MHSFSLRPRHASVPILLSCALGAGACGLNESPSTPETPGADAAASSSVQVKPDPALAEQVPAKIKDAGVIRMATQAGYPPFGYMDTDGKTIIGFDIDLAHAIGAKLGVKVEPVNTSFDAIIPALRANKVDMAMASIGDTKEREQQVDFTTYYWNGTLILVPKGNPKGIKGDLACGVSIGVIRGSLQQSTFLPAQAPKCQAEGLKPPVAQAYQDGPQAQLALKSGRIDGVMQDAPPLLDQAKKNPDAFEVAGPLVRNPNPGGVAFPKGSALVKPVNAAINQLMKEGTYDTIVAKWNLKDIAIDASTINGAVK
jgi:polar amino acid transport system substrate-binding protein